MLARIVPIHVVEATSQRFLTPTAAVGTYDESVFYIFFIGESCRRLSAARFAHGTTA